MGRANRLHLPGSAFHIVARTQGHEPWFADHLKDQIADTLLTGISAAGARTVAFVVMDNHFHVILFQGKASLGETMQPPMRRIALLIQKSQGRVGHIFERRYRSKMCQDSEHLPNAILYVHRNPVAARMCARPTDYRWSSANAYEGNCAPGLIAVNDGLHAFGSGVVTSHSSMREAYLDRLNKTTNDDMDAYWSWFVHRLRRRRDTSIPYVPFSTHANRSPLRDLRDVALNILRSIDDTVDSELVRSRYGGARIVHVRTQLVAALIQRDYAGVDIAHYLRISEATVSKIRSAMRWSSVRAISGSTDSEDEKQVR